MSRARRRRGIAAALGALLLAGPSGARSLDYLYVEPSTGGAGGGHVALRIGDRVHHYRPVDGTLRSARLHIDWFRYLYSVLENRTIHVARIDVDDATWAALEDRFAARAIVEQQHFAVQRGLSADRRVLERLRDAAHPAREPTRAGGAPEAAGLRPRGMGYLFDGAGLRPRGMGYLFDAAGLRPRGMGYLFDGAGLRPRGAGYFFDAAGLRLRGAGYFFDAAGQPGAGASPRLAGLRARVRDERGAGWLARRIAAATAELAALDPARFAAPALELSADRLPGHRPGFADRLAQLTLLRLALEAIEGAAPLRPEARITLPDPELALEPAERAALARFDARLERDLLALLDSRRPDRGYPLLAGLARLVVVDESLAAGRWVLLDTFPADALAIRADTLASRAEFVAELEVSTRDQLAVERRRFASGERVDERLYQGVEDAANRSIEVIRGRREGRDIRVHGPPLVPHGELAGGLPWLPELDPARAAAALDEARRREREHRAALRALYRYELFTRNCVTEIFATVDAAIPPELQGVELGGRVPPDAGLHFWPVFAFRAVERTWRVAERGEIPSWRRTRLEQMKAREHPLEVHLREASTLTSTVYRRNPWDSFFLFFTRDAWLPRPLYGAANLLAGVGQSALGLARLPFDRGASLAAGAQGVAFSLPELAFVSVRKGHLEYARSRPPRTTYRAAAPPGR